MFRCPAAFLDAAGNYDDCPATIETEALACRPFDELQNPVICANRIDVSWASKALEHTQAPRKLTEAIKLARLSSDQLEN